MLSALRVVPTRPCFSDRGTGQLQFVAAPDYESAGGRRYASDNVYQVQVTADDGAGRTTVTRPERHSHSGQMTTVR